MHACDPTLGLDRVLRLY